jgi:hypothetical protein
MLLINFKVAYNRVIVNMVNIVYVKHIFQKQNFMNSCTILHFVQLPLSLLQLGLLRQGLAM